ncbi:MAG: aldo/keto reductase [Chitinivibrionia bacterium]|nr:aldo/keto reductase [Chitinivibrionia bacterium]
MNDSDKSITRRSFFEKSVACIVGAGAGLAVTARDPLAQTGGNPQEQPPVPAADKPNIKEYRRLGRTGWKVSDISFGNAGMQTPELLEYAIERGINYVDTARQYYDMEKVIGQIFPAKRDKLFVATKLEPELFTPETTMEQITTAIDESLQRLNTDYVDCCQIHSVGDPNLGDKARIENKNIYEAFAKAKQAGKIRFWGASSHGPKMVEDFNWLIDNTDVDLIMPGMNYLSRGLEPVIEKARAKDIAVVAMKSLSAARKIDYSEFMQEGRTVRQALLKWMLAYANVDTISLTTRTFEEVDEFVAASGQKQLSPKEQKALNKYGMLLDKEYCRPGCAGCLGSCPKNVPIHDILRYSLYFNSYQREKYAIERYASLPASRNASQCAGCAGPCTSSCPYNIPVRNKLVKAHIELTV